MAASTRPVYAASELPLRAAGWKCRADGRLATFSATIRLCVAPQLSRSLNDEATAVPESRF